VPGRLTWDGAGVHAQSVEHQRCLLIAGNGTTLPAGAGPAVWVEVLHWDAPGRQAGEQVTCGRAQPLGQPQRSLQAYARQGHSTSALCVHACALSLRACMSAGRVGGQSRPVCSMPLMDENTHTHTMHGMHVHCGPAGGAELQCTVCKHVHSCTSAV
jgi:hypothetical protein